MKKRVIKDYQNLPEEIREAIRDKYPQDYTLDVITFFDKDKHLVSALPYETDEVSYLIKMPLSLNLREEEDQSPAPLEAIPDRERLEDLDEEKYLLQEEEEEESD
jgi:DNA-directed RNA polymerase subunit delta